MACTWRDDGHPRYRPQRDGLARIVLGVDTLLSQRIRLVWEENVRPLHLLRLGNRLVSIHERNGLQRVPSGREGPSIDTTVVNTVLTCRRVRGDSAVSYPGSTGGSTNRRPRETVTRGAAATSGSTWWRNSCRLGASR